MAKAQVSRVKLRLLGISTLGLLAAGSALTAPLAADATPHPTATPPSHSAASQPPAGQAAESTAVETPAPKTAAEVAVALAALAATNEQLSEQLNAATAQFSLAESRAAAAVETVTQAQATLTAAQQGLGAVLAQRYRSSSFSRTAALLTSPSGQSYLDSMQSLEQLSSHQADLAATATSARHTADLAQKAADQALYAAVQRKQNLQQQRAALNAKIARYQALLAMLTVTERTAYLTSNNASLGQISVALQSYTVGASPADIVAIKAALAELGKPYIWAAAGPGAFDCSGLTSWSWARAGKDLPHLASAQQGMGTPVPLARLRPADLVFFGSPAYHVAMYLGAGMIIQAPNSGDVVKISPLASMRDYAGATRIG